MVMGTTKGKERVSFEYICELIILCYSEKGGKPPLSDYYLVINR